MDYKIQNTTIYLTTNFNNILWTFPTNKNIPRAIFGEKTIL